MVSSNNNKEGEPTKTIEPELPPDFDEIPLLARISEVLRFQFHRFAVWAVGQESNLQELLKILVMVTVVAILGYFAIALVLVVIAKLLDLLMQIAAVFFVGALIVAFLKNK